MNRNEIFGRLLATMNFMGRNVAEKNERPFATIYMKDYARKPKKYFKIIHERLMERAHKFGPDEVKLMDIMGELVDELEEKDFTNEPLSEEYLSHYYNQNSILRKSYVWERDKKKKWINWREE